MSKLIKKGLQRNYTLAELTKGEREAKAIRAMWKPPGRSKKIPTADLLRIEYSDGRTEHGQLWCVTDDGEQWVVVYGLEIKDNRLEMLSDIKGSIYYSSCYQQEIEEP